MSQYSQGPGSGPLPPAEHPHRRRRLAIIAALIAILLIIFVLLFFLPRPTATVTLTPVSKALAAPLTVSIPTRGLSSAEHGSQTGSTPGTHAKGILTFKNWNPYEVTIPKGTALTDATGQQVVTDEDLLVPPDPIIPGVASVSATAVKVGKNGNIQAMSVNRQCCFAGVYVLNESAFSGGMDDSTVQQSDIDRVAKLLIASLEQQGQSAIQGQLNPGEQLVNPTSPCPSAQITSNPGVGVIAASFTVDATLICTNSAYNKQTALPLAESMLKQEAAQQFGPNFVLVGIIATSGVGVPTVKNGSVDVTVMASGTWRYQFTAAQKLNMAELIARKTVSEAKALLLQQPGVASASISATGPIIDLSGHSVVPDDLRAITING
jgi:hypothetical protein